mmetsp:Transcript_35288/g.40828  ORF Transcript_35288/g.40828 Transcript_35288/m.40828 type:complete len:116 (+) Transcript_35288:115-462(+)
MEHTLLTLTTSKSTPTGRTKQQRFHDKQHTTRTRLIIPAHFPAPDVLQAYTRPVVDTDATKFTWGHPDVEKLHAFCDVTLGWDAEQVNVLLNPVMEKLGQTGRRQTRLDSFFMTY